MDRIMIFLLSFYFGAGSFFSFLVAPELFKQLEKQVAGGIVDDLFPIYFGIGVGAVGASLLMGITSKMRRFLIALLLVNFLIVLALEFYVVPSAHELKAVDYNAFRKMHLISMIMNTLSLFLTFGAIVHLIARPKNAAKT